MREKGQIYKAVTDSYTGKRVLITKEEWEEYKNDPPGIAARICGAWQKDQRTGKITRQGVIVLMN